MSNSKHEDDALIVVDSVEDAMIADCGSGRTAFP
jgi:hypothetical protein